MLKYPGKHQEGNFHLRFEVRIAYGIQMTFSLFRTTEKG